MARSKIYSFQSTPVIANGRIAMRRWVMGKDGVFQSTPVIANGRIDGTPVGFEHLDGVSIHARYC